MRCHACIDRLGCPAIFTHDGTVKIDDALCNGCGLCPQVCPTGAIKTVNADTSSAAPGADAGTNASTGSTATDADADAEGGSHAYA